jgi:RNA polymerase sigma-70 factor (ECF subfamily)
MRENLNDELLIELLQGDDKHAFEQIYRKYWPVLLDAAYKRLRDEATCEELVQDLFVSLYTNRHKIAIQTSLIAYLKGALKYKVLNEIRSRMVRNRYNEHIFSLGDSHLLVHNEQQDAKELQRLIDKKIDQLPKKCREVFLLSRNEHLSHKLIAERLGISVSTVEKHIGKALQIIRSHVNDIQIVTVIWLLNHR